MELELAIKKRRSVRTYRKADIDKETIAHLLDLARYTPSSMNGQPWHFVVIRSSPIKKRIAEIKNRYCPAEKLMFQADFIKSAPVVMVVCVDKKRSFSREIENGVLATATIMLAAANVGIGSVYMSAYKTGEPGLATEIHSLLKLPSGIEPINIIPLGYPDRAPEKRKLRPIRGIVHYDKF